MKYLFTQVETVGDKYMTVSGLPEPCTHHAKSICHLALDMMEIAGQVKVDEEPVQVAAPYPGRQMEMFEWCKWITFLGGKKHLHNL